MSNLETKTKELMGFVEDVAKGLYFMNHHEISASFPVDGKRVDIKIELTIEDLEHAP